MSGRMLAGNVLVGAGLLWCACWNASDVLACTELVWVLTVFLLRLPMQLCELCICGTVAAVGAGGGAIHQQHHLRVLCEQ